MYKYTIVGLRMLFIVLAVRELSINFGVIILVETPILLRNLMFNLLSFARYRRMYRGALYKRAMYQH